MMRALATLMSTVWKDPSNRGERARRVLLALAWQAYKRTVGLPLVLTLDNGRLFYADPRAGNSTAAIYSRVYELRYIEFLRRHCVTGGAIVDVGAHIGIYTLLLADMFSAGLCFEPAPDTFSILTKNLALNELKSFLPRQQAVSSRVGRGTLVSDRPYSGVATLSDGTAPGEVGWDVDMTTVDASLPADMEVHLLKIDVEGHEAEVLEGATQTLGRNPRALVLFERHSAPERCCALLRALSFRCFALSAEGEPVALEAAPGVVHNILACGPDHPLHERVREG